MGIDERRTYALLDTALNYGGVDDRGAKSYRTEDLPAYEIGCVDPTSIGSMTADMSGIDGLRAAATIADRYEQRGWAVQRYVANPVNAAGEEGRRIFIASTDEISLRGFFNARGAQLGIRTGPCQVDYVFHEASSLQVDTFDRDPAQKDDVDTLLDTAIMYGTESYRGSKRLVEVTWRLTASFPRAPGCNAESYQANTRARIEGGGGLIRAIVIADRYEGAGWVVERFEDRNSEVRWFIANRAYNSVLGEMRDTNVSFDVRAGICSTKHKGSELISTARRVRQFTPAP